MLVDQPAPARAASTASGSPKKFTRAARPRGMLALSISINPHMNTVNALWQSISIASVTVVSRIVFEEPLTYLQLTGVVLATLASLCFVV